MTRTSQAEVTRRAARQRAACRDELLQVQQREADRVRKAQAEAQRARVVAKEVAAEGKLRVAQKRADCQGERRSILSERDRLREQQRAARVAAGKPPRTPPQRAHGETAERTALIEALRKAGANFDGALHYANKAAGIAAGLSTDKSLPIAYQTPESKAAWAKLLATYADNKAKRERDAIFIPESMRVDHYFNAWEKAHAATVAKVNKANDAGSAARREKSPPAAREAAELHSEAADALRATPTQTHPWATGMLAKDRERELEKRESSASWHETQAHLLRAEAGEWETAKATKVADAAGGPRASFYAMPRGHNDPTFKGTLYVAAPTVDGARALMRRVLDGAGISTSFDTFAHIRGKDISARESLIAGATANLWRVERGELEALKKLARYHVVARSHKATDRELSRRLFDLVPLGCPTIAMWDSAADGKETDVTIEAWHMGKWQPPTAIEARAYELMKAENARRRARR